MSPSKRKWTDVIQVGNINIHHHSVLNFILVHFIDGITRAPLQYLLMFKPLWISYMAQLFDTLSFCARLATSTFAGSYYHTDYDNDFNLQYPQFSCSINCFKNCFALLLAFSIVYDYSSDVSISLAAPARKEDLLLPVKTFLVSFMWLVGYSLWPHTVVIFSKHSESCSYFGLLFK